MTTTYGTLTYHPLKQQPPVWSVQAQPHVMIRVKRVLPRVQQHRSGRVLVSDTLDVARDLQWLHERYPLEMSPLAAETLAERLARWTQRQQAIDDILSGHPGGALLMEPARQPRDYQMQFAALFRATRRLVLADDVGLGKAQPLDAPVLTPTGYRPMGSLAVGDEVIAGDGTPTRVTAVHPQGERDCYRVTFSDGVTVECDDQHLWRVRRSRRTRSKVTGELNPWYWQTRTLRHLIDNDLRTPEGRIKWHVPMMQAPNLDAGGQRPLDPYLLGVLLGDGGFTASGVVVTTADTELATLMQQAAPPGVLVKHYRGYTYRLTMTMAIPTCSTPQCGRDAVARGLCGRCYQAATVARRANGTPLPPSNGNQRNPVVVALGDLGLWGHLSLDKFVPDAYKLAPAADRLALLQGLMDTDGYAMPLGASASAFFYSSSCQLAEDVRWLTESLGGTGRITIKHFAGRDRFTVTVKLPQPLNPFRLTRKAERWGDGHAHLRPTRAIVSAEHIGRKPMQCIAVEHPDRLYITDRFTVTHNTLSGLLILDQPDALPALVVTLTHLPQQWLGELLKTWPGLLGHVVTRRTPYDLQAACKGRYPDVLVMNYHKLAGWAHALTGQVKTVLFDEGQELRHGTNTDKGCAAAQVTAEANYAAVLSATPVYNRGGEIWNIVDILDKGRLGSREEFLREWGGGTEGNNGQITVEDPQALGTYLRSSGLLLRRTRKDVHRELPEPIRIRQEVDADPAKIDELAGDALQMAQLVLSTSAKQQDRWTAAGELDLKLRQATGVAKAPYVAEFVRLLLESEQRVVLFAWHRAAYAIYLDRLKAFRPVLYTGTESPTQKNANAQAFTEGDSRVLMMSLRAGAGLDGLQEACSVAVFGELDWSPGIHDQCVGRLARDGQESTVAAYFMVSNHGSDPPMDEVLQLKRMQAEPIRDPDAPLLSPASGQVDRVRLLAQSVLDRAGGKGRTA